jgi:hypothetical protein
MSDLRDAVRAEIFNNPKTKPAIQLVDFMGAQLELRTPTLGHILAMPSKEEQEMEGEGKAQLVTSIIQHAYIPGTDELVFEDEDLDGLLGMAYSADMQRLFTAMNKLIDPNFKEPADS